MMFRTNFKCAKWRVSMSYLLSFLFRLNLAVRAFTQKFQAIVKVIVVVETLWRVQVVFCKVLV